MARAGANGLGTIKTSKKWQFKFPSWNREMASSNCLRRPCRVSPARVRLITSKPTHWALHQPRSGGFSLGESEKPWERGCALHVPPKNYRMDVNKTQTGHHTKLFKNAAIFSRFGMVPRPLARAQAMRSRTCVNVIQPCRRH